MLFDIRTWHVIFSCVCVFFYFAFYFLLTQANLHVKFMFRIAIKWDEEIRTQDINYDDEKDTK